MNFVIDNYTTNEDTHPLYFNTTLLSDGHKCKLLEIKKESLYDVFDKENPDVYITHGYRITQDLVHYLQNNNNKKIDIIVNIQNMKLEDINNLSAFFFKNNITSSFFFLNIDQTYIPKIKDRNIVNILSAADINLLKQKNSIEYKINKAIVINDKNQIKSYDPPYHNMSNSDTVKDVVDFALPEIILAPLFRCYDTVIFRYFNNFIPQAFFDAIMFDCKVYFDLDDKEMQENLNHLTGKVLKLEKTLDFNDKNKLENFESLKTFVMEKHTSANRIKAMLSNIKVNK